MAKPIMEIIAEAHVVLARVADPKQGFAILKPRDEDYDRVFVGAAAAAARAGYAGLWAGVPPWPARPDQTELHVAVAYTEDFAAGNERAAPFPGGYKTIAASLAPGVAWLLWEAVAPGERNGIVFDGLVPIDDRWAWFPKPWRVVPEPS